MIVATTKRKQAGSKQVWDLNRASLKDVIERESRLDCLNFPYQFFRDGLTALDGHKIVVKG